MTSPDPQYAPPEQPTQHNRRPLLASLAIVVAVIIIAIGALLYKGGYDTKTAEQAAMPTATVAGDPVVSKEVTAPGCAKDEAIYWIPIQGPAKAWGNDKWVDPVNGISLTASFDPSGTVGEIIVTTKPGEGVTAVKLTTLHAWRAAMNDKFKAQLTDTPYEPVQASDKVSLKETKLGKYDVITACAVVNKA